MKYLIFLTTLLIFKIHEINATPITIPGYTYWVKCLTTDETKLSSTQISYDTTSNKYSSISISYSGTTPSKYSSPIVVDRNGFGYKYSYLQHSSFLDAILDYFSGPTFTTPNSITPVDMGGFFVYLLDKDRSSNADPLCGTTTSFVGSCTQQKIDINPDWCLLIGNFFVNQSVSFDISYQTYDIPGNPSTTSLPSSSLGLSPISSSTSTKSGKSASPPSSAGMSKTTEINIIIS
ncbi:26007_t:CDS:2, partial [Gigaspora margarita]